MSSLEDGAGQGAGLVTVSVLVAIGKTLALESASRFQGRLRCPGAEC